MLTMDTPLLLPETVAFQSLGESGQTVLVSMDSGYLFTCNETTRAFLEAVDGDRTLGQIVDILCGQFEVDPGRLRSDMCNLARRLMTEGLLVASDGKSFA